MWSRNGAELFYQSGRRMIEAEIVRHGAALEFNARRVLFEGGFVPFDLNVPRTYDVAKDGRFLTIQEDQRPRPGVDRGRSELVRRAEAPRAGEVMH